MGQYLQAFQGALKYDVYHPMPFTTPSHWTAHQPAKQSVHCRSDVESLVSDIEHHSAILSAQACKACWPVHWLGELHVHGLKLRVHRDQQFAERRCLASMNWWVKLLLLPSELAWLVDLTLVEARLVEFALSEVALLSRLTLAGLNWQLQLDCKNLIEGLFDGRKSCHTRVVLAVGTLTLRRLRVLWAALFVLLVQLLLLLELEAAALLEQRESMLNGSHADITVDLFHCRGFWVLIKLCKFLF